MWQWTNVEDKLPRPFEIVWIYWRDREVALGCRTYEGKEELEMLPQEGWYSIEHQKCRYTWWWQSYRIEKPRPPESKQ